MKGKFVIDKKYVIGFAVALIVIVLTLVIYSLMNNGLGGGGAVKPVQPVQPVQPVNPVNPVNPQ